MIDWINNFFGIKNEVSVPIIISIAVFLTGGVVNFFFIKLRELNQRKLIIRTTIHLLKEIVKDLKYKEINTNAFQLTLTSNHKGNWFLKHHPISYLETLFLLNFYENYSAFQKRFLLFSNKKLRERALHRVWASLRNLKFVEDQIQLDLENFYSQFNVFYKQYNLSLSQFRDIHDEIIRDTQGKMLSPSDYKYLKQFDEIWFNWGNLKENDRIAYDISYNHLIKPCLKLNRSLNREVAITKISDKVLLDCEHQFIEMENLLRSYQEIFKNRYYSYRGNKKLLEKCIKILK